MATARRTQDVGSRLRSERLRRGWSQAELAERCGLSRAGVSAIEGERLVPSVASALALAAVLGSSVEALFGARASPRDESWALAPGREPCRYWLAEVGGRRLRYPVEDGELGSLPHDGVFDGRASGGPREPEPERHPERTLILASCNPAAGLIARELERRSDVRLLVLRRSSGEALRLLAAGLVHAAGLHLARADEPGGNAAAVAARLGAGYALLRVARWQEGLAFAPSLGARSVRSIVRARLRWIGREAGSGARACLDELFTASRPRPRREAHAHRGVAEAVRSGWADVGICLRLASDDAGLEFLSVREEAYELCLPVAQLDDPRIAALVAAVRSRSYRDLLSELPGYDASGAGELSQVPTVAGCANAAAPRATRGRS